MKLPFISVLMATYNHASYVAEAINSVLQQQDVDFEFLIADDGSTDATARVVESIFDPRIRFFPHRCNRGACVVLNELIERASGEFIALINSDDRWTTPDKLAEQVALMLANPALGACFGRARFVDERGAVISGRDLPFDDVFLQGNRTQGAWLRHFFEHGNCICHPTMMIRRRCFDELGRYNNNLRQLPDFEMWIRLVKRYPIYVSERELVDFRVLPRTSASSQSITNSVRIMNEHYLIAESLFDDVTAEHLTDGFGDLMRYPLLPSEVYLDIEKALLLLGFPGVLGRAYSLIGLLKLNRLLASAGHQRILEDVYGIDSLWFQKKAAEIDVLRPRFQAVLSQFKWRLMLLRKRILAIISPWR